MTGSDGLALDALARADVWDRCWPGNVSVETLVNDLARALRYQLAETNRLADLARSMSPFEPYRILQASTVEELEATVFEHLAQGWQTAGGPFTFPWAAGHGPVHQIPATAQGDGWVYITFCQAVEKRP